MILRNIGPGETMQLRLGLEPWSFNWEHTWSQDLMTLGFLMSQSRKNSVRDKVIHKKWIYLERNSPQTVCGPSRKARAAPGYGVVSFISSVVSDSLRPHGLQHAGLPWPTAIPGACSNSHPSSWWCRPMISPSFLPAFNLFQHQSLFSFIGVDNFIG